MGYAPEIVSLFPSHAGWQFRKHGGLRAIRTGISYREAEQLAITYCKRNGLALFRHRSDGTVRSVTSY